MVGIEGRVGEGGGDEGLWGEGEDEDEDEDEDDDEDILRLVGVGGPGGKGGTRSVSNFREGSSFFSDNL